MKDIEVLDIEWENAVYSQNDRVVKKYFQMACAFGANLLMACYGLVVPASGFLIPQLEDKVEGFGITLDQGSWLASVMVLGALSGAFCGGLQSGKFGRRKSLMFDSFLFVVGTLLMTLAPNFYVIILGRLIHGHSSASAMVAVPIYTSEISQPQVRKLTGNFTLICYSCGFAFALILGALFPWRWAIGSVIIVPFICLIILFFCPETPVWYLMNGQEDQAKKSLIRLRGEQNMDIVETEFNRISLSLKIEEKENKLYNEQKQSNFAEKWSILTSLSFWKPFCLLNVVFTIGLEWTGLPAIAFYMVPLLEQSQVPLSPYWAAAMLASYRALMSVLGSTFNGKCQRRPLYLSCCAINIIGLTMLSAYCYFNQNGLLTSNFPIATWIPIISIMILYSGYGLGFGGMPYQLQGELLPSNARSFGSGLLGIIDNISLFVSCKMAPTWNEILGIHGAFLMYACNCALVALICFFCMPETSTMTLEEIETMYKTEKKAPK